MKLAFSPNRLSADSGPTRGAQPRHELLQYSAVLSFSREASERMGLAGSAGSSNRVMPSQITADETDCSGALAHLAEIDFKRAWSEEGAERGDAIAHTRDQDGEFGPCDRPAAGL
jgi:hypothetical protein